MTRHPILPRLAALVVCCVAMQAAPAQDIRSIDSFAEGSGTATGLVAILHGDAALATELARSGRYLVHLFVAGDQLDAIRRQLLGDGVHGRVVVSARTDDARLPHPDRFIDVLMADLDAAGALPVAELHRVVNSAGTLLLRRNGKWETLARAADKDIDEWTHKWRNASGHVLSQDRKVAPPTTVQWVTGPALADSATSGKHPVIGSGAIAVVDNVGRSGAGKNSGGVVVRSAGNGLIRWRGDFDIATLQEMVIDKDRLLLRPLPPNSRGETGPLTAFDLRTGKLAAEFAEAPRVTVEPAFRGDVSFSSFVVEGNDLIVAAGAELAVLDRTTGKRRWTRKVDDGWWLWPVVGDGLVVAVEAGLDGGGKRARIDNAAGARRVIAFSLADGEEKWATPTRMLITEKKPETVRLGLLPPFIAESKVFLHSSSYQARAEGAFIAALDLKTGAEKWRYDLPEGSKGGGSFSKERWTSTDSASRIMCREGKVFYLGGHGAGSIAVFDADKGTLLRQPQRRPAGFGYNGECSGSLGTVNWLIMSCVTWWDRDLNPILQPVTRSACGTGSFPAQGMLFSNPTGCDCTEYARGYLGFNSEPIPAVVADEKRLTKGPSSGKDQGPRAEGQGAEGNPQSSDWLTFLGNPQRSGATTAALREKMEQQWRVLAAPKLIAGPLTDEAARDEYWTGPLTAPTIAGDRVFVGLSEAHAVACLDAATGRLHWRVPLSGPMDSPPTLYRGLCIVGTEDGFIHALRQEDGALAWRFFAAPTHRSAMLHGRLASAFPVPGSVLILGDKLLATAGFHTYAGGIHGWVLNPMTGEILAKHVHYGEDPLAATDPEAAKKNKGGRKMILNDVLCADAAGTMGVLFRTYRLGVDGKLIEGDARTGPQPVIRIDRRGALMRFPHNQRGGSTHGWSRPMGTAGDPGTGQGAGFNATHGFRIVREGEIAYVLMDPTQQDNYFKTGPHVSKAAIVSARTAGSRHDAPAIWQKAPVDLGFRESYTAMIKAGDKLILGGGKRDGSAGFVQILSARDGALVQEFELPALVAPSGLAATSGGAFVSLMNGELVRIH